MEKQRRATREDVARRAGVSTAVISYVLNDGPRPVAEATRRRVLDAIEELGYRPSAAARALKLARSGVIGLVVPDISNSFFAEFAKHLQDAAHAAGYSVMLGTTGDPEQESEQVRSLLRRDLDGLVVFGIEQPALLETLLSSETRLVSMDWQLQDGAVPTIVADDYGATRAAIEHLREVHGHTRIGFIGGPDTSIGANARKDAWRDALAPFVARADLARLEQSAPFTRDGGYRAAQALAANPDVSAMFAASDIQAIGALRALRDARVAVPKRIAMMSFDGTVEAEYSSPSLSVVAVPIQAMAQLALKRVLDEAPNGELHAIFPHELKLRESCGCER
ncbi:substrate-binding domain-containing protein [Agromyces sp. CFH 90414]|uniref:Substrate-binding domain-containing protein n=1 Tax=Agromyces agglutinans TaxID=2662258 RepID=A0A6I2F905_9MICO|nr:LacI family DNA-binding transcriptional regulator [Agromyces agglutinans]MRG60724.1 substrate-binding domain-containing protein [Agromyces agglutinans]